MSPFPERTSQVLVAGAGMAGLCATLAAAEAGADVTVLEKGGEVGGAARLSAGLIWTLPTFELNRKHVPEGDAELQRTLSANFAGSMDWLEQHGLPLESPQQVLGDGWGRVMGVGSPGRREAFAQALRARAETFGARVLLNRRLVALRPADSGYLSVQVESREGRESWKARNVVLATGGYQGNRELLARYLGPASDYLMIRGPRL